MVIVAEFVGGALLGAAFGLLLEAVTEAVKTVSCFKTNLKRMESILNQTVPMINEIEELNKALDISKDETSPLIEDLRIGTATVKKCAKVQVWNKANRCKYSSKLEELEKLLQMNFTIVVAAQQARDIKKIQLGLIDLQQHQLRGLTKEGSSGTVPGLSPGPHVGLDVPLLELTLTARPRGYGKMTLVKSLCADKDVQEKFIRGAALEDAFSILKEAVVEAAKTVSCFESKLKHMESILIQIVPIINQFESFSKDGNLAFRKDLKKRAAIVRECAKVGSWNYSNRYHYSKELNELENLLQRTSTIFVAAQAARDIKKTQLGVMDLKKHQLSVVNWRDLKRDLFKDDVQVLIRLTAPRGCGKTTLVISLCMDKDVQGTWKDIFLWRRKKQSVSVLILTTAIWVLLDIYKFNLITILCYAAMAIVSSLFLYDNIFRLLGKEAPNLDGLEMTEHSAMEIAKPLHKLAEETVRWMSMYRVSAEREWPAFVKTVAGLLLLSYLGSFSDLLTLLYLGTIIGITIPPFYLKYEDKIKRCKEGAMEKTRRMCAMLDEKVVKKMKNKMVRVKV